MNEAFTANGRALYAVMYTMKQQEILSGNEKSSYLFIYVTSEDKIMQKSLIV